MSNVTVIPGKFANGDFVPDGPFPLIEGRADLIVYPGGNEERSNSIFDLLGRAPVLRSGEDIL
jgi:hypothetical protein